MILRNGSIKARLRLSFFLKAFLFSFAGQPIFCSISEQISTAQALGEQTVKNVKQQVGAIEAKAAAVVDGVKSEAEYVQAIGAQAIQDVKNTGIVVGNVFKESFDKVAAVFSSANRKDFIKSLVFENRTDYKIIFRRSQAPFTSDRGTTISKELAEKFYLNPNSKEEFSGLNLHDRDEETVFMYDVLVTPDGKEAYYLGRVVFGYSCNRIIANAIGGDNVTEEQKLDFDGFPKKCSGNTKWVRSYIRDHHNETWNKTGWGVFYNQTLDGKNKNNNVVTVKTKDGKKIQYVIIIYYEPDDIGRIDVLVHSMKITGSGMPCKKDGKDGKTNGTSQCVVVGEQCKVHDKPGIIDANFKCLEIGSACLLAEKPGIYNEKGECVVAPQQPPQGQNTNSSSGKGGRGGSSTGGRGRGSSGRSGRQ